MTNKVINDLSSYLSLFNGAVDPPSNRQREALKQALDIRKFEIDTYWKRATYFWALITASFVAFFSLRAAGGLTAVVMGGVGMLFSMGWYLVNRGSSSWQRNWEIHVDLLEDAVMGPLHKTHINRKRQPFLDLAGPYPYSPSRINTILSIITVFTWPVLLADLLLPNSVDRSSGWYPIGVIGLFGLAIFSLFYWGRSRKRGGSTIDFEARTRTHLPEGTL